MMWYKKLADTGDAKAKASYERVEYMSTHGDSLEFEEKDKLYTDIAEARKAKGKEPRYKVIEASRLQYQYTYVHDQVEGFIHKLPKGWVKTINESTGEEYYAPSLTYKDFAMYVYYDSVPKDSKMTLENYLRYCNDAFDEEPQPRRMSQSMQMEYVRLTITRTWRRESCHLPSIMDVDWHV